MQQTTIKLSKKTIIDQILSPVSKLTDSCTINITDNTIYCITANTTSSIIFYANCAYTGGGADKLIELNIKDARKLMQVLSSVSEDEILLKIGENASTINYKSDDLSFKLHLVNSSVIKKTAVSREKIDDMKFDTDFIVTYDTIKTVTKYRSITESDRIYISTVGSSVYAELTDKTTENVDSATCKLSDTYNGPPLSSSIPFSAEALTQICSVPFTEVRVCINNKYKVMVFQICEPDAIVKYIVSSLTK